MSTKPNQTAEGEPLAHPSCPGMRRSLDRCLALWEQQPLAAFYIAKLALEDRLQAIYAVLARQHSHSPSTPLTLADKVEAIEGWHSHMDSSVFKQALAAISELEQKILWTQEHLDLSDLGMVYDAAVQADTLRKALKASSAI